MPVGDIRQNPQTGDVYKLERVGNDLKWIEQGDNAALAVQAAQGGVSGAFAGGLIKAATFGIADDPVMAEQADQFPLATLAGELSPLAAAGAGMLARRSAQTISARAAQLNPPPRLIRRPSNILGRGTATGQAARLVEGGLEAVPGLNLPGIVQKAINQRRINRSFARALGLSDDAIERAALSLDDIRADVFQHFDDGYRGVYDAVGANLDQATAQTLVDGVLASGYVPARTANLIRGRIGLTGDDMHALRSQLTGLSRAPATPYIVQQDALEYVRAIDEIIERALVAGGDDAAMTGFREINAQFSIWAELRKGRGIGADGMLNPRTADGRFMRAFGDRYAAGEPVTGIQAVDEFLATVREGAQLDVGLPSSGTAERAAGALLIGGGIGAAAQ